MATIKDLAIKLRINVLTSEVDDKGKESQAQGHIVEDMPKIIVDSEEWNTRLSNAALVLNNGYDISATVPHKCETYDAKINTAISVTLKGRSTSNGIATTVGFQYGVDKTCSQTHTADQNADSGATPTALTYTIVTAPSTKYYFRAYGKQGTKWVYGRVLSFTTPAIL